MGFPRIATSFPIDLSLFYLHHNQGKAAEFQQQLSTGSRIQRPSDDPFGVNRLLRSKLDLGQDEQYRKNLDSVIEELNVTDGVLAEVSDTIQRARELALQAANQTYGPGELAAIGEEVERLFERLVQLGNTSYLGRSIFAGFRTGQAAFTQTGTDVAYNGTPLANPYERNVEVARGTTIAVNVNGDEVFGNVTVVAGPSTTGSGVLRTIRKMVQDLQAANYTELTNDAALLATDLETVNSVQARIGARVNQAEALIQINDNRKVTFNQQISNIQDADIAEVVSKLASHDSKVQASLSSLSRILNNSLVNFLR